MMVQSLCDLQLHDRRGVDIGMTFRGMVEEKYGSILGFCKAAGFNSTVLYGVANRKRAASRKLLEKLKNVLGSEVAGFFDEDRILIRR